MATLVSPGVSVTIKDISVWPPLPYYIRSDGIVDGEPWYSIGVNVPEIIIWVMQQDNSQWVVTDSSIGAFDIHEELLVLMKLRFPR